MTTRRTLLQGAAALIAPVEFAVAAPLDFPEAGSPFGVLIGEYRRMLDRREALFEARNRIEADLVARGLSWSDSPALDLIGRNERAWYDDEKALIRLASRTPAFRLDDVMRKLILWRLVDVDAEGFDNPCDMLSFSAYRDLLALAGRAPLTPKADEKALKIVWDDRAFSYFHDDEDDGEDEGAHEES